MKKVALHNLGCKVNAYEVEAMQQMLIDNGYEIVPFEQTADIYIVNTCSVTNMADRKSRQMLHRAKKRNPDAVVIAAGCYVQTRQEEEILSDGVDLVIGNNKKQDLIPILHNYFEGAVQNTVIDINHTNEYENLKLTESAEHTRAYIKIQDGCNQFCSYCIIPYARGRVRSRAKQDILEEITRMADKGYKEVVLTGIHISSYGVDMEENLLSLIEAVHEIKGIERIRLGSLEPRIITEDFAKRISELEKICPHFHLSLQSGCEETLKRMNRHYSAREYMEKVILLRRYYKKPAITTDVIVGFPGETEEEFIETCEFLRQIDFYEMHIFKYSRRQGTRAALMNDQVAEEIKNKRSTLLIDMAKSGKARYEDSFVGQKVEILIEEEAEIDGESYQTGHTKEYIKAAIKENNCLSGNLYTGKIKGRLNDDIMLA